MLCLFTLQSNAQSVGLVLSGGGAKGMAHIGLIRVLEENNIPIDYIAGTSIGAIVGGLYAAGYSPDEMEELFKSDDFYFWSTGKIQKEYRYHFKISETTPEWLELGFTKTEDEVKLLPPTNIVPVEQMNFAFMELFAATNAIYNNDFDSLMVPFFCVATDISNNVPVILRNGDLGESIRASMTIPLYFKPIEIDGTLLFDGGILNNFPHNIMREFHKPDIIIGHKVANDAEAATADNVIGQISNIVMRPTNFEIKPEEGILLETKFTDVGLLDFNKIDQVLETGENTALQYIDSIMSRIDRRISKEYVMEERNKFNAKKPQLLFQNIQVEGVNDPEQTKYIIQSIKRGEDVVSLSSLKKEYFKLVADEQIKSIQPVSRYNNETGYFDLHLKIEPEKRIETNFGGNISTRPINQWFASIDYRFYKNRAYNLSSNVYFGRFYNSFKFGGRIDFPSKLPFYLAGYSTINRWDFFSSSSEIFFEDVRPPYIIQFEYNTRVETGFPLGMHSKLLAGISYSRSVDEYYQPEVFKNADKPDNTTFSATAAELRIENNSLNYDQYATEGALHYFSLKYISGKESYNPGSISSTNNEISNRHKYFLLNAHSAQYFNLSRKFTLGTEFEATFSNKELMSNYTSTMLSAPGYHPTPHSKSMFISNFHSNNYLAAGLRAILNFNKSLHLRVEGYGFLPVNYELYSSSLTFSKSGILLRDYYLQGLAALVYQTGVGPLSLALNYYEKESSRFYLTLNFGYILFNKRGF
jgi:NTE family protein